MPPDDTGTGAGVQQRPAESPYQAQAWLALVSNRGGQSGVGQDVAHALANHSGEDGQVEPPVTVDYVMRWAGRPRLATRKALSALFAAGLLRADDEGRVWLTVPSLGETTDAGHLAGLEYGDPGELGHDDLGGDAT